MRQSQGVTLVELLAVTLVIVFAWAVAWWATAPAVGIQASRLSQAITSIRASSVSAGVPAAVFGARCAPSPIPVLDLRSMAVVVALPPRGLLFAPDGLPRTCDGGGVGNTTILLEHRGRQAAVIVSSLGRVRWELR